MVTLRLGWYNAAPYQLFMGFIPTSRVMISVPHLISTHLYGPRVAPLPAGIFNFFLFKTLLMWSLSQQSIVLLMEEILHQLIRGLSVYHTIYKRFDTPQLVPGFLSSTVTRWWFHKFFISTPIWERWDQFDEHIFPNGLVQPPTR